MTVIWDLWYLQCMLVTLQMSPVTDHWWHHHWHTAHCFIPVIINTLYAGWNLATWILLLELFGLTNHLSTLFIHSHTDHKQRKQQSKRQHGKLYTMFTDERRDKYDANRPRQQNQPDSQLLATDHDTRWYPIIVCQYWRTRELQINQR